ncbi:hypothetical protein GCM10022295_44210 [Streptomyces osmaniensis]|uniref:Uncharacterized protein n=1 Tax=Streptomyces osmaniensis TaxID=593134 RepID=A0ABP6WX24_9ACTN
MAVPASEAAASRSMDGGAFTVRASCMLRQLPTVIAGYGGVRARWGFVST